jgi:hypothetical protein
VSDGVLGHYYNGIVEGEKRERERIIKLLQDQWLPIADVEKCIALINGEASD